MATVLTQSAIWAAGMDLSGTANKGTLDVDVDDIDTTTFGSGGYKEHTAGLKDAGAAIAGFIELGAGSVEQYAFESISLTAQPVSLTPVAAVAEAAQEGDRCFLFTGAQFNYSAPFQVGTAWPYTMTVKSSGLIAPVFRGQVATPKTAIVGTEISGVLDLGAGAAGADLAVCVHLFSIDAGSIDVLVETDDNVGMASAITAATVTADTQYRGAATLESGEAERYVRMTTTLEGGATAATFAVTVGASA